MPEARRGDTCEGHVVWQTPAGCRRRSLRTMYIGETATTHVQCSAVELSMASVELCVMHHESRLGRTLGPLYLTVVGRFKLHGEVHSARYRK
jgi:hypothetical protein